MLWLADRLLNVYPLPDSGICTRCGVCSDGCPAECISIDAAGVIVDRNKCVRCFCCTELCPEKAMKLDYSWLAQRILNSGAGTGKVFRESRGGR